MSTTTPVIPASSAASDVYKRQLWHLAERWGRVTPDGVVVLTERLREQELGAAS